jgi:uncharacterized phage protein (TIGR01671 family)
MKADRYKFRGKRTDNRKWVYGYLLHGDVIRNDSKGMAIGTKSMSCDCEFSCSGYRVIPETVGQFTGLHDKNGKEIYEDDILEDYREKTVVCYNTRDASFLAINCSKPSIDDSLESGRTPYEIFLNGESCVDFDTIIGVCNSIPNVIGNIHDNPDLLTAE